MGIRMRKTDTAHVGDAGKGSRSYVGGRLQGVLGRSAGENQISPLPHARYLSVPHVWRVARITSLGGSTLVSTTTNISRRPAAPSGMNFLIGQHAEPILLTPLSTLCAYASRELRTVE